MAHVTTVWRMVLAASGVACVAIVINVHIPFSGVTIVETDFRAGTGIVSHLYPVARVGDTSEANGRSYRPMIEDPVYFDVTTIVPFRRARIDVLYDNTTKITLAVGMKFAEGGHGFELKPLAGDQIDGWTRGSAAFDLSAGSYYNSTYTFAFSVPGLRTESSDAGEVRLSHMTLTLERDPLSWNQLTALIKK